MKIVALFTFVLVGLTAFTPADLKPVDTEDAVTFSIKNFGLNVKGEIKGLAGTIKWDPSNLQACLFNVSVNAATINTGITGRDNHLKKEEYFHVEKYPVISFQSISVTSANGQYHAAGNLIIKGTSKPVDIVFSAEPSGSGFVFTGNFTINRRDFNIGGGSMVMGNEVKVNLKINAHN
ncbi:YceI family protein [Foetidibacter luteolus]|uniref:YceI family protein n=1 Tax=Foetidibacter luteolus TaxID=2608880 RepID=UPI00129BF8EF|nr:YceI family protein [Foetidibacter luteolus]